MAVRSVSIFHANPGKRQEFLKNAAEAKKILERLGGRWRAAETTFGGPNTGNIVVALEFDDMAGFSAFTQKQGKDSEWLATKNRLEKAPTSDETKGTYRWVQVLLRLVRSD